MMEKLKNMDFSSVDTDETNNILNEMLSLNDEDLKESVFIIIDSINYESTDIDNIDQLSIFYKTVFENDKIKEVMQGILEDYEKNI